MLLQDVARRFVRIAAIAVFVAAAAFSARAQSGPAISTQAATYGLAGSTFFAYVPIANTGSATAGSVEVTSVTLSSAPLLTPALPLAIGDLSAGSSYGVTLTFNSSGLTVGKAYLLTLRGTYEFSGSTLGFSVNRILSYGAVSPFAQPPNPLSVTPTLDTADAVTEVIVASTGGTIAATGADGSIFTLVIPANALLSNEAITMTPLTSVAGLPVSGGLLAGVQLSPDGLQFQQPATLTIQPAASVPVSQQVGFGYHANGSEFYFQPLGLGSTITISLMHFSAAGVGQGTPGNGGNPTNSFDELQQQAQQIISEQRACGCNANYAEELEGLYQEYYEQVVSPLVQAATTDYTQAQAALAAALDWARGVELLSFDSDEPFATEISLLFTQQIPAIYQNFYNQTFSNCLGESSQMQRTLYAADMLAAVRALLLMGDENAFPDYVEQVGACAVGPLTLSINSSLTTLQTGQVVQTTDSNVSSALPIEMTFNSAALNYQGSGALDYNSYSYSIQSIVSSNCSSGSGIPGTASLTAEFDLNTVLSNIQSPGQIRMNIGYTPDVSETTTQCQIIIETGTVVSDTVTTDFYNLGIEAAHQDVSPAGSVAPPYFLNVNGTQTFDFAATSSVQSQTTTATENTTMTLQQESP